MKEFSGIRSRIESDKNKNVPSNIEYIFMRHMLMKTYGWIPYSEFRKIPAQEVFDLVSAIMLEQQMTPKPKIPKTRGRK